MEKLNCVKTTWDEMHNYAKNTCDNIKKDNFRVDIIIGLSRGGLVPARMFCDFLHVKNCYTIKVDHWGITASKDNQAKLTHKLNLDLSGKNILVVDDITDTGQSMILAIEHLKELNPKEIKTATMIHLKHSKYKPDFYGKEMDRAWIVFPWNYREDMVNLIKRLEKEHIDDIKKEMKDNFNVDIDKEELKEILEHIEYVDGKQNP